MGSRERWERQAQRDVVWALRAQVDGDRDAQAKALASALESPQRAGGLVMACLNLVEQLANEHKGGLVSMVKHLESQRAPR